MLISGRSAHDLLSSGFSWPTMKSYADIMWVILLSGMASSRHAPTASSTPWPSSSGTRRKMTSMRQRQRRTPPSNICTRINRQHLIWMHPYRQQMDVVLQLRRARRIRRAARHCHQTNQTMPSNVRAETNWALGKCKRSQCLRVFGTRKPKCVHCLGQRIKIGRIRVCGIVQKYACSEDHIILWTSNRVQNCEYAALDKYTVCTCCYVDCH